METIEQETIIDAEILPVEPEKPKYQNDLIIPVELSEEQEQNVQSIIRDELQKIAQEYSEGKYYDNLESARKEENGIADDEKPENWKKMQLVNLTCEIVASRGLRQTYSVRPFMLLEKDEEIEDNEMRDLMDGLDFRGRNKYKLPELDAVVYKKACLEGAAIVKSTYCKEVETQRRKVKYKAGDLQKYEDSLKDRKNQLLNPESKEFKDWETISTLQPGQTHIVEQEIETVHYVGAKAYRVPLDKFYARLSIKNFRDHILIAEEMNFRWKDIEYRSETGFYDSKKVDELKEKKGEDYWKEDYRVMECVLYADIEKKGKTMRYLVSYDVETEIILRIIHYPNRDVCYTAYCAIPRDDSWLGFSFNEKMKHVVSIAESFLNATINESNIAHNMTIMTDDNTFDADRHTFKLDEGKINVVSFTKGTQFKQMEFRYNPADRVALQQWAISFSELVSGVSASLMSGAETPQDPRAPAAKTAMKMQTTNMRVEDVVLNLQKGDEDVCRLLDMIEADYATDEDFVYFSGVQQKKIAIGAMMKKYRYQAHGSRLAFDRATDVQIAIQTAQFLSQFAPEIMQDYQAREALVSIVLNGTEGSIEKHKDKLLRPLKLYSDAAKEKEELNKQQQPIPYVGGGIPQDGMPITPFKSMPPAGGQNNPNVGVMQ